MLKLTLDIGPTDNRRLIPVRRGKFAVLVPTEEFDDWKKTQCLRIKPQLPKGFHPFDPSEKLQLPYGVRVFLPNRRIDAANFDKGLRDLLKHAGVWTDDKWAAPQFYPAIVEPKSPRIEVYLPECNDDVRALWPVAGHWLVRRT